MTRHKLSYTRKGYGWSDTVMAYMSNKSVRILDDVVCMYPRVDKQAEVIYSQLVAEAWGLI